MEKGEEADQMEMERWHRGGNWENLSSYSKRSNGMERTVEAICQQWHERLMMMMMMMMIMMMMMMMMMMMKITRLW